MLLKRLSLKQWREWQRFAAYEPWGFDVDDHRQALMALTVASAWGGGKDLSVEQFLMGPDLPARAGETQQKRDELVAAKLKAHFKWKPPEQRGEPAQQGPRTRSG